MHSDCPLSIKNHGNALRKRWMDFRNAGAKKTRPGHGGARPGHVGQRRPFGNHCFPRGSAHSSRRRPRELPMSRGPAASRIVCPFRAGGGVGTAAVAAAVGRCGGASPARARIGAAAGRRLRGRIGPSSHHCARQ
eukprot:gene14497-biopygen12575